MTEPAAVLMSELTPPDARELLRRFVDGHEQRLSGFLDELGRRGGPVDQMDRSLPSLEPLWRWMLRQQPSPATDGIARRDGPWWYPYHPPWGQELGPELANLATGLAEYFYACAIAHHSATWRLGRGRSMANFQQPVLALEGRGEMSWAVPIIAVLQACRGDRGTAPADLRLLLERWLGLDPEHEAELQRLARPIGSFVAERIHDERFTHRVDIDEGIAHGQQARIGRLVAALAADPGIEVVVQEDREVLLVRASTLDADELHGVVTSAWKASRARP